MPVSRDLQSFGFVYGITGTTRGSTTSSGVFTIPTTFSKRVVFGFAEEAGAGLRNNNADPAANTGVGTYTYYRWITVNQNNPITARFRAYRSKTLSAASAVSTLSRNETLATAVTALLVNWLAFGY